MLWGYAIYRLGVFWHRYDDYSYGWFVPLLCLCLFWERWKRRPRRSPVRAGSGTFAVLGVCALALLLAVLFLTVITHGRFAAWLFALTVVAITIIALYFVGGRSYARFFLFPVLFFLIAVPWPSRVQLPLTGRLSTLNAAVSARVANHLGTPAVRSGVIIETGAGPVGVDEACSGIRSFQASLMVSLFLGELFQFGFFRRVLLLLGGVGIALFCNVVRTTYLVRTCDLKGLDAVNLYHDRAGFTILGITFAGLLVLAWLLRSRTEQADGNAEMRKAESRNEDGMGQKGTSNIQHSTFNAQGEGGGQRTEGGKAEMLKAESGHANQGSTDYGPRTTDHGPRKEEAESRNPESGIQSPSLPPITPVGWLRTALVAVIVWVVTIETGIELWFSPLGKKMLPQQAWALKLPRQRQEFRQLPISKHIQDVLRFDEGTMAEWRDVVGHPWKLYYFRWLPATSGYGAVSADAQQWGHGEFCLVSSGMILQTNLGTQSVDVNGAGIAFGTQRYLSHGRNFHIFSAHWKAGLDTRDAFPQLNTSGFGIQFLYHALKTRDRGRNEQRVIQMGVWEMESDEAALAAFRVYLGEMIAKEGEGEKDRRQKTEVRGRKTEDGSEK